MSRRILETLIYLARNHPYVAKLLLQLELPGPPMQKLESSDQAHGKAVMVIEEEEDIESKRRQNGDFSIVLLLSLLNQPLYLRSTFHLEPVMLPLQWQFSLYNKVYSKYYWLVSLSSFFFYPFQLLNLLEVVIDNAESNSSLSKKSGISPTEQPSGPETAAPDAEINTDIGGSSSGNVKSSKIDECLKSSAVANSECDAQAVLHSLPQAELRLLCSLLAREGYDKTYVVILPILVVSICNWPFSYNWVMLLFYACYVFICYCSTYKKATVNVLWYHGKYVCV